MGGHVEGSQETPDDYGGERRTQPGSGAHLLLLSDPEHSAKASGKRATQPDRSLERVRRNGELTPSLIDLGGPANQFSTSMQTGDGFLGRVGEDFARGHKEATGGIIKKSDFELFASNGMEIGVKDPNAPLTKKEKAEKEAKSNGSLMNFFGPSPSKKKTGGAKKEETGAKEEVKVG